MEILIAIIGFILFVLFIYKTGFLWIRLYYGFKAFIGVSTIVYAFIIFIIFLFYVIKYN